MVTLPGLWRHKARARTGWPGVLFTVDCELNLAFLSQYAAGIEQAGTRSSRCLFAGALGNQQTTTCSSDR